MGQFADWNFRFSAQVLHRHKCRHGSKRTCRWSVRQMTQVFSFDSDNDDDELLRILISRLRNGSVSWLFDEYLSRLADGWFSTP